MDRLWNIIDDLLFPGLREAVAQANATIQQINEMVALPPNTEKATVWEGWELD